MTAKLNGGGGGGGVNNELISELIKEDSLGKIHSTISNNKTEIIKSKHSRIIWCHWKEIAIVQCSSRKVQAEKR